MQTERARPPGAGRYADLLDVVITRDTDALFEVRMDADAQHENAYRVVHGGVQMSLLDIAMGGAVARTLPPDESCASVSITTDFVRPGGNGPLFARATLLRKGRTMAFPTGELVDARGTIIARATGVWAIRPRERADATPRGA